MFNDIGKLKLLKRGNCKAMHTKHEKLPKTRSCGYNWKKKKLDQYYLSEVGIVTIFQELETSIKIINNKYTLPFII